MNATLLQLFEDNESTILRIHDASPEWRP